MKEEFVPFGKEHGSRENSGGGESGSGSGESGSGSGDHFVSYDEEKNNLEHVRKFYQGKKWAGRGVVGPGTLSKRIG